MWQKSPCRPYDGSDVEDNDDDEGSDGSDGDDSWHWHGVNEYMLYSDEIRGGVHIVYPHEGLEVLWNVF